TENANLARYQADFRPVDLFHAGLSGYDATFSLAPGAGEGLPGRTFARPVEVQITGSLLVYDLADPAGGKGEPVKSLSAQFPDMRRFIREGYVRYAFTKFGVPYVVSIQCLDSAPRARRLACREAYPVAERFLKALRVAGGLPSQPRKDIASIASERPTASSPDFTYRASGDRRQAVVAVRDGVVIRVPKQQAATLQINTRTEHIRFRYMHMNPSAMDADGLLNGRRVNEGEQIGVVSNYLDRPNGTSRHLHFDVQVFTRDGWLWVNPYTTLISAYERLIGGRGRETGTDPLTAAAIAHAMPADAMRPDVHEGGEN